MMKKLLIFLLILFSLSVYADVDTKDGVAITTSTNQDGFSSNIAKIDGQTIASGEVTRVGSVTKWGSASNTGNNAVTVESDAEMLMLVVSGFSGTANYMSSYGAAPSLCDATDCLGTDQDLTTRGDCDDDNSEQQAIIFSLANPNTGSQYIVWDWYGSGAPDEGLNYYVIQYKNVNASQSWQNGCDQIGTTYETGTLTATNGDVVLASADTYDSSCSSGWITWTNATDLDSQCNNNDYSEIADDVVSGNVNVSQVPLNTTYSVIVGVIIEK